MGLKAAAVFGNFMVLQQNKEICFFGTCDGIKTITVSMAGTSISSISEEDGKWKLYYPPLSAGGPYEVIISDGTESIIFTDVMTGEVWFAGGQSNMQFELANCCSCEEAAAENEKGETDIRFYITARQAFFHEDFDNTERSVKWLRQNDTEYGCVSAVAYYAALELSRKMPGVSIGVICCCWGGTSAAAWTDRETLLSEPETSVYISDYENETEGKTPEQFREEYLEYTEYNRIWYSKYNELIKQKPDMKWHEAVEIIGPDRWCPPPGPYSQCAPSNLFSTMFMRMCPYTVKGIWFYQGESDDHRPGSYYVLLKKLIGKWRSCYNDDSLPFIFIQLPVYGEDGRKNGTSWALIRENQEKISRTVSHTAMVPAIDQGEYGNIHPSDKRTIGRRLAEISLHSIYGIIPEEKISCPVMETVTLSGVSASVRFTGIQNRLVSASETITGFEIADDSGVFRPASAQISSDGKTIVLKPLDPIKPVYVRYLFRDYEKVTLFGENGLPAMPFRTDTF